MLGGIVLVGLYGDSLGRRTMLRISAVILTLGSAGSIIAPEFWSFIIARAILGFSFGSCMPALFSYTVEITSPTIRGSYTIGLFLFNSLGSLSIVFLAMMLIPDMEPDNLPSLLMIQTLVMVISAVGILFWIDESPMFLVSLNQIEEAARVLNRIARVNGMEELGCIREEHLWIPDIPRPPAITTFDRFKILFAGRNRGKVLGIGFVWWAFGFCFYGFVFIIPMIIGSDDEGSGTSDILQKMAVDATTFIPGLIISMVMVETKLFGRKGTILVFSLIMSLSSIGCVILHTSWFSFLSSIFLFASYVNALVIFPYTAELFQTEIRTLSVSFCNIWAKLAGKLVSFHANRAV